LKEDLQTGWAHIFACPYLVERLHEQLDAHPSPAAPGLAAGRVRRVRPLVGEPVDAGGYADGEDATLEVAGDRPDVGERTTDAPADAEDAVSGAAPDAPEADASTDGARARSGSSTCRRPTIEACLGCSLSGVAQM
jgi:hypothetical protein